jgi:YegS/Rv2252/BmrU family lipid kinase
MGDPPRELVFLANANARRGKRGAFETKDALEDAGIAVKRLQITRRPRDFEEALAREIALGTPLVAVGGGDGTQRTAAERIAGTGTTMAVVPLGTGNAWARDLGMPLAPGQIARAIATSESRAIDLGVANGRGFVNVATIGLTALIVRNLPKGIKGAFGRLAYLPAVLKSVREVTPFRVTVETDVERFEGDALLFVAAVGRTHAGPFPVTRAAQNDDGLLSLYVLHDTNGLGLLKFGVALLTGRHTSLKEVWTCEATTARVKTNKPRRAIVDGEPLGTSPLQLGIRPGALKVLVPKSKGPA